MRSVVLTGMLMLAGCDNGSPANKVTVVDIRSGEPSQIATDQGQSAASSAPVATPAPEQRFQALGTEPFWSLDVTPGKLRYSSPENLKGTTISSSETKDGASVRYTGTLEGKAVALTIEPGTCSDGMSDTVYPYKASFTWGDQTQQGCARAK
jgi:uncharacterized membrane protein